MSASDLQTVLAVLSAECGRALWKATGLCVSDPEARAILDAARAALARFEGDADDPYSVSYSAERAHTIREEFHSNLIRSVGTAAVGSAGNWLRRLLQATNERDWYQGLLASIELVSDPLRGHGNLMLDKADRDHLLNVIAEQLRSPADQELMNRSQDPQTEFDRRLFARRSRTGPPTTPIHLLLLRQRYEEVLARVPGVLTARGSRVFLDWLLANIGRKNALADHAAD